MKRFRDTKTGRLVSEKKWRQAQSRGSKRYKREIYFPKQQEKKKKVEPYGEGGSSNEGERIKVPKTIHDWERYYADAQEFEDTEEIEGGADY